ncbi:MAG: serine/threonine-protein kinase [Planctomycetota bacterium]
MPPGVPDDDAAGAGEEFRRPSDEPPAEDSPGSSAALKPQPETPFGGQPAEKKSRFPSSAWGEEAAPEPLLEQPSTPSMTTQVGDRLEAGAEIGPYKILETIGEGGMGVVFKAEQRPPLRRMVALKIIKAGLDSKEVIARFEAERQALAMMDHPGIAKVFDAGTTPSGKPFFAMEFVAGQPISDFCDLHRLSVRRRLMLFADVCDAIQHAHNKGVIHRDLKPANVLVSLPGGVPQAKIIDFGVAKALRQKLSERTLYTETGQLVGTPEYMSPEQAEGGVLEVDIRSDVYSLGVLLYELLCGCLPFDSKKIRAGGVLDIQRMIRDEDPPRPSQAVTSLDAGRALGVMAARQCDVNELRKELARELEWIVLTAMRKDRTERYATAAELGEDVRRYLADKPLKAAPVSWVYAGRKFLGRNKGVVAIASAVAASFIVGVGAVGYFGYQASVENAELREEIADLKAQLETR